MSGKDKREQTKEEKALQHKYSGWGAPEHESEPPKPEKVKKQRHVEPPKEDNGDGN